MRHTACARRVIEWTSGALRLNGMNAAVDPGPPPPADRAASVSTLLHDLDALRQALLQAERAAAPWLSTVHPLQAAGAHNLVHFLAMRQHDLRDLQSQLAHLGLSSLGRAEPHVLTSVERVRAALRALAGHRPASTRVERGDEPAGGTELRRQATAVFGPPPFGREVRIMVTLPGAAADEDDLLCALIGAGMDVARINAAHDDPATWERLASKVRTLSTRLGRPTRVLIDLPGPKLRTGPLPDEPPVVRVKPRRDDHGRVVQPGTVQLRAEGSPPAATAAAERPSLIAPAAWLAALEPGTRVRTVDTGGRRRTLQVMSCAPGQATLSCDKTVYIGETTELRAGRHATTLGGWPRRPGALRLSRGDRLELRRIDRAPSMPLSIPCTLPEVFAQVRTGDRIAFDDGRILGVVRRAGVDALDIEIDATHAERELLGADRGINLPSAELDLPVPTALDRQALDVAARAADMVALSFAQRAQDVRAVHAALAERQASHLPVLLKIETRLGFENLPELMVAAMAAPATGVMIARGDLAVELGWQRLAEVQEEILWAAEAAHVPVVWATQVLESMARHGQPSRAEITDAAMSVRAEAVMLNKGPHVVEAVRMLDDILRRMQEHQHKKRPLLRALRAWQRPPAQPSTVRPRREATPAG
jgi:pyruvate kinase